MRCTHFEMTMTHLGFFKFRKMVRLDDLTGKQTSKFMVNI